MNDKTLTNQAFKLKGRLYTLTVLGLMSTDLNSFKKQLAETVEKAPKLFEHTPAIIDCSEVDGSKLELQAMCQAAREMGIVPVAVQGGNPMLATLAKCQGLAVLNASSNHDRPLNTDLSEPTKAKIESKNRTVQTPVRSGQQIACQGDLIITSSVSNGAEVLADGNIHIYGPLRGRALAGINGDKSVRIFCKSMEAELVSIAGFYKLSDTLPKTEGPCQIYLKDDQIQIKPI